MPPPAPGPAPRRLQATARPGASLRRRAAVAFALLPLAALALLAGVKWAYGGGRPYPNVSTAPLVAADRLETLAELALPPGNVASSGRGRVFFNTHPFAQSHRFADAFLFELVDGKPRPYPDAASQADLRFFFGLTVDALERLWLISPATLDRERTRIVAYDLATDRRVFDHTFEPGVARFAQDLRVSPDGRTLYLADTGAFHFTDGAIVVVEIDGGSDWRARPTLRGHASTKPQDWFIRSKDGPYRLGHGLLTFAVGVDGLALSPDGAWLYYGSMSHDSLYRVRTEHLRDRSLSTDALGARVERVGPKPLSDGIAVRPDGSVLITDVENGGLARLDAAGALRTLVRSDGVVWADGVAVAPDGAILFTDSAIPGYIDPLLRPPSRERLAAGAPYRLYRLCEAAAGAGRGCAPAAPGAGRGADLRGARSLRVGRDRRVRLAAAGRRRPHSPALRSQPTTCKRAPFGGPHLGPGQPTRAPSKYSEHACAVRAASAARCALGLKTLRAFGIRFSAAGGRFQGG